MNKEQTEVAEALRSLRQEVAGLNKRLAALEAATGLATVDVRPRPDEPAREEGLSEEVLIAISAAVAAFLGARPRIRQIRLLGSANWANQGRVNVQASHALHQRPGSLP
ncbi:MAG TPA: hypothetical protein VMK12_29750 [Anaeromyxobacteraceae bacterium]|nr:hypothetical protein [Anaeromyxobacteraceae bacterium]